MIYTINTFTFTFLGDAVSHTDVSPRRAAKTPPVSLRRLPSGQRRAGEISGGCRKFMWGVKKIG